MQFVGCGDAFGSGGRFNTCFHVSGERINFLIDCGASSLPALKRLDAEEMVQGWDDCAHLFVRARRNAGLVDMSEEEGEEEPIDVRAGDVYIARYHQRMQQLLRQGHIDLI